MTSSPPSDESESDTLLAALASSLAGTSSDPWVILRTVPRVHAHAHDRDLFFELAHPPHLSLLTVSTRVSPARPRRQLKRRRGRERETSSFISHPRILTADLSAGLFLTVTPTPPTAAATATDLCGGYFVLDAASCTSHGSHRVPAPVVPAGSTWFGVIAAPDGGSFMVVGIGGCLNLIGDSRRRASLSLHCFSSRTGVWVTNHVNNPLPHHRTWTFNDVIAYDGKLWWVDTTTKGLLYCDPFADHPTMAFIPLPNHVTAMEARGYDYVQVADGKLRWVHVVCELDETTDETTTPSLNGAPLLSIYAVLGADDDDDGYRLELEVLPYWRSGFSFSFIWESDSFKATEMPKDDEQPALALIDPNDADLLYFFLGDYLFGFDICKHVVLGYAPHGMADPDASSSSLLAWKLPPALAAPTARSRRIAY